MIRFWGVGIIFVVIFSVFGMFSLKLNIMWVDKCVEEFWIELVKC